VSDPTTPHTEPFFRSRWVPSPAHVSDLGPTAGLPAGFRAGGVACGIKPSGNPDVGILICDTAEPVSAARFTASSTAAAPVLLSRERCQLGALRAVLVNSGCANAATGRSGLDAAAKTQGAAAMALGVSEAEVALASTGAIQTTDLFEKRANLRVELSTGQVMLSAQCKGAGMISPNFATMLCFVQTDAAMAVETAELLLGVCIKRSFDRCSVDGQLSTNDTAILMCSGASGVRVGPDSEDEVRFGEALDALLRQLAILMVTDGEGAARIARVIVHGGDPHGVELAARGVANSPLVKAALHGGDPNWGRIVQAVGGALPSQTPLALDVFIEQTQVCSAGAALAVAESELAPLMAAAEVEFLIRLPGQGAETEVFFSDLSHEYVTINADYTT
jgi:glutamate N-acetyltransferase/amino-acid N-acetyltransferase